MLGEAAFAGLVTLGVTLGVTFGVAGGSLLGAGVAGATLEVALGWTKCAGAALTGGTLSEGFVAAGFVTAGLLASGGDCMAGATCGMPFAGACVAEAGASAEDAALPAACVAG